MESFNGRAELAVAADWGLRRRRSAPHLAAL